MNYPPITRNHTVRVDYPLSPFEYPLSDYWQTRVYCSERSQIILYDPANDTIFLERDINID
jgi:hypothetical protein